MPSKAQEKRIRPVIEEVVEEKYEEAPQTEASHHEHHHKTEELENVVVPPPMEPVTEEPVSEPPSKKESKMNLKLVFVMTILTALVVGFVAGGVYVYFSGVSKPAAVPTPKSTTTPEPAATSTPKPSATPTAPTKDEISKVSVSVLNGSGKIGEASKVKELLTAGDIKTVSTGNASRYDYKATVIQFKKEVTPALRTYIEKLVAKSYTVEIDEKDLASSSKTDVVITVGQE